MKRVFPLFWALLLCLVFFVTALAQSQSGTAKQNANLRSGPGKTYAVTGQASSGQTLTIVGKNAAGTWLQLDSGQWIAASLVNVAAQPVTAAPPNNTVGMVEAQVMKITDGDTIEVAIQGQTYRLRYILIDTPESNQPYGSEATEANRRLVEGKTVYLAKDVSETDRYGRLLRYVYLADGTFVNAELVRQGYATVSTFPPDVSKEAEIRVAQQEAFNASRGLWAAQPAQPVAAAPSGPAGAVAPPAVAAVTAATRGGVVIRRVNKEEEYVDIVNQSGAAVDLAGWQLLSVRGNQSCPLAGVIEPGTTLRIWAMAGAGGYSCNFGSNIWNNKESDPAILYNAAGQQVSALQS